MENKKIEVLKNIKELNEEETKKLLYNNEFNYIICESIRSDVDVMIDDVLKYFKNCKGIKWSFNYYGWGYNYIEYNSIIDYDIIDSLEELKKDCCILNENDIKLLEEIKKDYEENDCSTKESEKKIDIIFNDISNWVIQYIKTSYYYENIEDLFLCNIDFYNDIYKYDVINDELYKFNENYLKEYIKVKK